MPNMRQRTPGAQPGAPQQGQSRMIEQLAPPVIGQPALPPPRAPQQAQQQTPRRAPIPLTAPTTNPEQPVTAGMEPQTVDSLMNEGTRNMLRYLPELEVIANSPLGSTTMRSYIQYLKSFQQ